VLFRLYYNVDMDS